MVSIIQLEINLKKHQTILKSQEILVLKCTISNRHY